MRAIGVHETLNVYTVDTATLSLVFFLVLTRAPLRGMQPYDDSLTCPADTCTVTVHREKYLKIIRVRRKDTTRRENDKKRK